MIQAYGKYILVEDKGNEFTINTNIPGLTLEAAEDVETKHTGSHSITTSTVRHRRGIVESVGHKAQEAYPELKKGVEVTYNPFDTHDDKSGKRIIDVAGIVGIHA